MEADERAWSGLETLRPYLRAVVAARCRDAAEVDDVVQETLLRAARYRRSLAEGARLEPWAARIACNVLATRAASAKRMRRIPEEELELAIARETPDPAEEEEPDVRMGSWILEREAALRHVSLALEGLREDDRRILRSYYRRGGNAAETAAECDVPRRLVKVRLFRARRRLHRALRARVSLDGARHVLQEER